MNQYEVSVEYAPYQYHTLKIDAVDEDDAREQADWVAMERGYESYLLTVKLIKEHGK